MTQTDLYSDEARQRISKLAEGIDFAMMATGLSETPIHMIPMSTKKVDGEGRIWFLSGKDSQHNQNINKCNELHLVYSDGSAMQFLNVFGTAKITADRSILKELYASSDDAWFDGIDDPNLTAICVTPTESFYWDPKNNKLVTMFRIGVSAVTGDEPDIMDHGRLNFQ